MTASVFCSSSTRASIAAAILSGLVLAGCGDERSITSSPAGALGFGTNFVKTSTNLPRGNVTYPVAIVASATPATDSVITVLAGLDSLSTGTYTLWFGNDSATKWVRVTNFNMVITRVDSSINSAGDPVFTTTTTTRTAQDGFRAGGSNLSFRVATARNAATGMPAADSLNTVLVSVETGAPGATPGEVRALWTRRSQANANRVATVRFGTFRSRLAAIAGAPTASEEFVFATNGVQTIVPRGRVEVRDKIMIVNDSNYLRPPVGYYYNAYGIKLDTTGRFNDTLYLGRRTTPYPARLSLFDIDKSNPDPSSVFDSPFVVFAMATRASSDTLPKAAGSPPWRNFGFLRSNVQSKYSQEGRMGPNTIIEATLPPSVRGR
jgi:hypothetical protein